MSQKLLVGTRKGLFRLERSASGNWEIADVSFLGDNVTMALHDPRDGWTYCALNLGHFGVKLHRTNSLAKEQTWEEVAVPVYPAGDDPESAPSLDEIWALEPGGSDQPELLWCGTIPGGLFRSTDRGSSWEFIDTLWNRPERADWFGGGKDHPGIHSICVHPEDSQHVTVGVSCGGVWKTRDGGATWDIKATGMRAEYMPPEREFDPNIQDPHRVVCCKKHPQNFWAQHHNGVFRSTDDCESWQEIESIRPSPFGFAAVVHPENPDRAWFVPGVKDECRVPVDGNVVVARTSDGGQSFDVLSSGLPQGHAYDIVFRHAMDIDESGECLAMGSSTGSLWISENGGDDWTLISHALPQIYCLSFCRTEL